MRRISSGRRMIGRDSTTPASAPQANATRSRQHPVTKSAPPPHRGRTDDSRLATLRRYGLCDASAEEELRAVVELAASLCDAPMAAVVLVDDPHLCFRSEIGLGVRQVQAGDAFAELLLRPGVSVCPDLPREEGFAHAPPVIAGHALHFYAGAVLEMPSDVPLGALCVFDTHPRRNGLTTRQRASLATLARQAIRVLELQRRLAERDAQASWLADVFAQASVGLSEIGPDGRFLAVNDHLCAILGRSREELLRLSVADITHPEDQAASDAALTRLMSAEAPVRLDKRHLRPDGTVVWTNNSLARLLDGQGRFRAVLATTTDITAQHEERARQAFLLSLSDRLRDLADPHAIMATAAEALGQHLGVDCTGYAELDAAAERVTIVRSWSAPGFAPPGGTHRLDEYGPALAADLRAGRTIRVADATDHPLTKGREWAYAGIGTRAVVGAPLVKAGRLVAALLAVSSRPRAWTDHEATLIENVAERTWAAVERARVEARLRESEERHRHLVESATEYAIITLDLRGRITGWNQGAERILGYAEQEIVGQTIDVFFMPEDREAGIPAEEMRLAREEGRAADARWHLRRDGTRFWASGVLLPLMNGGLRGYLKIFRDRTAERETENALRQSEERLRRVQQIGRVGGFEVDLRTGINIRSAEYMGLQGLRAHTAQEQHADWVRRLHPDDRERAERRFLEAVAQGSTEVEYAQEYRIVTPAGEVRWIAARAEIERDSQGRALRMLGAHVDVTELKLAEAALAESMQRSREVLESLGDMLYALDGEGRIRFASRRALEAWHRQAEEVLGRRFTDVFPAAAGSTSWAAIESAARAGCELHLCAVSPLFGRWFELDIHPASGGGVTVAARDVHGRRHAEIERRRAEIALRASEERLRLAQEAGEVGTWEWNVATGVVYWSESCHRLHGTDPRQGMTFDSWRAGVHPDDWPTVEGTVQRMLKEGENRWRLQFRFRRRADGALRWLAARGEVVRDPATGHALRVLGIALDVTERREAEERQALLMRELDHRAKNALAVVQAAIRMTPKDDPQAFARAVQGRVAALARAHTLLAEGRWEGVGMRELIRGELAPFLPGTGDEASDQATEHRVTAEGPPVMLAPTAAQALSMTLHELATNATKHGALSMPGGHVSISWVLDRATSFLQLRWSEAGGPPITTAPGRRGFGSRVLEATVAGQLGGRVSLDWQPAGLVCTLEIPLSRALAGEAGRPTAAAIMPD